ncbi:alpha-amylase family glycosyl hydrolase [Actinomyces sp. B33]|uniref:alpha-amylase family glycosyl hydrolase n=1 Tax=Actinomyces sp. B33 TaxID=2942131 RepID=UPI0023418FE6|nr:alpha-amylase family glycosyl hydrolase [Actinomyces sp. B33]MDC4232972.1 alpha-amylase family glycosyl hydrolase [Actinomyces sp. B33]
MRSGEGMGRRIWWHANPMTAVGALTASRDPERHRLRRVIGWLDEVQRLGCDGLQLGPVFESSSHGYDTLDHFRVDPRLGDESDLIDLIDEAHRRGIAVMLDGVFNHVSRGHRLVADYEERGEAAPAAALLDRRPGWDGRLHLEVFEGHDDLVQLDHRSAATRDLVVSIMDYWCDRGADAFRLDAAYAVDSAAWSQIIGRVRRSHPDLFVLGEVIHGDYAAIVAASGFDSVTEYELRQAVWHSIADRNLFELDWTIGRHARLLESFLPATFISNHDVTRIATAVGPAGARAAAVVLMSLPGMPVVYHGDEYALEGLKEERPGGDDAIRPELPADLSELGRADGAARMRALYGRTIEVRRSLPWLTTATATALEVANEMASWELAGSREHERARLDVGTDGGGWARLVDGSGVLIDSRSGAECDE